MWSWLAMGFVVGAFYLFLCFLLARSYVSPLRFVAGDPPAPLLTESVPSARGGVPSWVSPNWRDCATVFVFAHGYGGNRSDWAWLMEDVSRLGHGGIALSMPGQDASPDPKVGFGLKEAQLLVDTVAWVRSESKIGDPSIILVGLSMGGAAAWIASEMDPTIDAIVTEGAFARFDEASRRFLERNLVGGGVLLKPVMWMASKQTGISVNDIVPMDAAKAWRGRPALVIHAEHDGLIDRSHADRLVAASGANLWIVPDVGHAQVMGSVGDEYALRLHKMAQQVQQPAP